MYCPRCGQELEKMDRTEAIAQAEAEFQREYDEYWELRLPGKPPEKMIDYSEHYVCWNLECRAEGETFNCHNPFDTYLSKPGDSWSLAWIK